MASEIFVKIARLGERVVEVYLPDSGAATVRAAIRATDIDPQPDEELRINGVPATLDTTLHEGDIITLVPKIRGG